MAVVSRRSALNPDAPLFIPATIRQIKDFSWKWWYMVVTTAWFCDYWLSQQQGDDEFFGDTAKKCDIADVLPDSVNSYQELLSMGEQYEQFLRSSENKTVETLSHQLGPEADAKGNICKESELSKPALRSQC